MNGDLGSLNPEITLVVPTKKEQGSMESKLRIGIDIGMFAFIIGAAFNAGITYNKLDQTNARVSENERSIKQLERDQQPLSERVARMEAILADIRDELRAQNERHAP